jgi:hypothetical protein
MPAETVALQHQSQEVDMAPTTRLPSPFDPASCKGTDLRRRAEVRKQNATYPRCVQCESNLVDWAGRCVVSAEEEQHCSGEFIRGDLLCVWC